MTATDEKDKKGGGAAALLSQLQSQTRAARGYDRTLFRVVEVTRGPDGRLSRQGRIWHSDLSHVRRFGRALAANSVSQQVVIADASGAVLETLEVVGPGSIGWNEWRSSVPPTLAPPAAKPPAVPSAAARPPAKAATTAAGPGEAGWATDTLFDDLPAEPTAAPQVAAEASPVDIGTVADADAPPVPELPPDFLPDPTITGEPGIVLP